LSLQVQDRKLQLSIERDAKDSAAADKKVPPASQRRNLLAGRAPSLLTKRVCLRITPAGERPRAAAEAGARRVA
jgi:hypothetical protein